MGSAWGVSRDEASIYLKIVIEHTTFASELQLGAKNWKAYLGQTDIRRTTFAVQPAERATHYRGASKARFARAHVGSPA